MIPNLCSCRAPWVIWKKHTLKQRYQTRIVWRATFQRKNVPRAAVQWKKVYAGRKLLESFENKQNFIILTIFEMFAGRKNVYGRPHVARGPRVWDPCLKATQNVAQLNLSGPNFIFCQILGISLKAIWQLSFEYQR